MFPRSFPFEKMKDVVIGRAKIDNYLMALMYRMHGYLIDSTYRGEIGEWMRWFSAWNSFGNVRVFR